MQQQLKSLYLDDTNITDKGISYLKEMKQIHFLRLDGTRITDKSVPVLSSMKNLEEIIICNTDISKKGSDELLRLLPKCKITVNWPR